MNIAVSTAPRVGHEAPTTRENYLNCSSGIRSWLFTLDHKRIGLMYLGVITFSVLLGGLFALALRTHLWSPTSKIVDNDTYNQLFTLHGAVMIFLFIIPGIPAALGNFVLPIQLGAKDVAFPRLNLLSLYLYCTGAVFFLIVLVTGGLDTGWTLYPPYSMEEGHTTNVLAAMFGVFVVGFSSIATGVNFIATIHKMRPRGMGWFDMPLFLWSLYATAIIQVLATPVLGITVALGFVEHLFHVGIFMPAFGGDPVMFQHFFWFYSHPAVYIMILPAMGVVSEVVSVFSRKPIFGYRFIAYSSVAIAVIGFLVWGHHMFVSGQARWTNLLFSFLTFFVAVPSAIKVFNWLATMYKGTIVLKTPMIYILAFFGLFGIGGLTGLFLATLATDVALHDTYFVVAHFHYVMAGAVLVSFLAGLHYWWPKMTGLMYDETLGRIGAVLVFVGFNATFIPQFIMGATGMPRRYANYPPEYAGLNHAATVGAFILGCGMAFALASLIKSFIDKKKAPTNPWGAASLEWATPSPPPHHNFDGEIPPITGPYNYDVLEQISESEGYVRNDGHNVDR